MPHTLHVEETKSACITFQVILEWEQVNRSNAAALRDWTGLQAEDDENRKLLALKCVALTDCSC